MADQPLSADDIVARASSRTAIATLCPDGQVWSDYEQALADWQLAKQQRGDTLGGNDEVKAAKHRLDEATEQFNDALVDVRFRELPPSRKQALLAEYTYGKEDAKQAGAQPGQIRETEFYAALGAEASVEPEFTADQLRALMDANEACRSAIIRTLDELHGGGADPKKRADIARRLTSDSSSTPQQS